MDSNESMDRRRFVKLVAAGAALAATSRLKAAEAAETRERAEPKPSSKRSMTAAMKKEIENQKKSVADMLKIVRDYELPAGSPPATVFRAMKATGRTK